MWSQFVAFNSHNWTEDNDCDPYFGSKFRVTSKSHFAVEKWEKHGIWYWYAIPVRKKNKSWMMGWSITIQTGQLPSPLILSKNKVEMEKKLSWLFSHFSSSLSKEQIYFRSQMRDNATNLTHYSEPLSLQTPTPKAKQRKTKTSILPIKHHTFNALFKGGKTSTIVWLPPNSNWRCETSDTNQHVEMQ